MAGDRGLAFVVFSLMAVSLTSIIQARWTRTQTSPGIVAVAEHPASSTSARVPRSVYFDSELKSLTRAKSYMPEGRDVHALGKTRTLLFNPLVSEDFTTGIETSEEIDASRVFDLSRPIE